MRPQGRSYVGPTRRGEVVGARREEGPEDAGDGARRDLGRAGAESENPRTGGVPGLDPEPNRVPRVDWQSALYVFVLALACVFLIPLTVFWWVIPLLGAAVPLALAALQRSGSAMAKPGSKGSGERELLEALAERGEMTPAAAAMHTSLTVDEASRLLDRLAVKGHLELRTEDGVVAYLLPGHGRLPAKDGASGVPRAWSDADPAKRLDEPLSERELEVLALLVSGRTNAEIARGLFVALGTVKSHVNNIYRKLGAANRVEAVARAREMRLLR